MPANIHISITAESAEDLLKALRTLNAELGKQGQQLAATDVSGAEDGEVVMTVAEAPKKGRTRAKKEDPENTPANDDKSDATPAEVPAETKAVDISANMVSDMEPKAALELANKMMQDFFLKDEAAAMAHVKTIQNKYGIKQFVDVPLDRAVEFLADVRLATSNNGEKAA